MHFLRNVSCRSLTPNVSFELANSNVTPCQPGSCVTAANSRYFYQHVSYVNKRCILAALFFLPPPPRVTRLSGTTVFLPVSAGVCWSNWP